jgi:CRP-like cAMP-binding protein/Fe-S-cluster-containing hydrogenase component 2
MKLLQDRQLMETHILEQQAAASAPSRVAALQQLDSMQHLPIAELEILAKHAVLRMFEPYTAIVAEQSVSRHVFLVIAGNVEQSMHDGDGGEIMLALLGRGDLFGEGGLFGVRYRRTSVRATSRSIVLQFHNSALQANAERLPQFYNALRLRFRERLLQTTLARVPLLAPLNPFERLSMAQQLDDKRVDRGVDILQAGGMSEGLYILAEGQATVVRDGRTLAVLAPGDIFGEMSLLDNEPHEATITALTPVQLLILPRQTFEYLLRQRPDVARGLQQLATARKRTDRTPDHIATTERLVETGIMRGSMALVRQHELCDPECQRCITACGDRFGKPRLRFSDVQFGALEAADTCRHCQWSAECVESCPEDAFRLDQDGHLVVTDRCTGCGICVDACPYDAINLLPVYASTYNPFTWLMRQIGRQQPTQNLANKCDACSGYDDHACVSACPTGALQWIPIEELYQPEQRTTSAPQAQPTEQHHPA